MRVRTLLLAAAVVAPALAAHAERVALKHGLWEQTVTVEPMERPGGPALPNLPDLEGLPPEQRAEIERSLAAMSGTPTIQRTCITPEMLAGWEGVAQAEGGCVREIRQQTPTRVVMSLVCDGGKTTGTMDFAAPSPERLTGTVTMQGERNGTRSTLTMKLASRWLGADCGTVKPPATRSTR